MLDDINRIFAQRGHWVRRRERKKERKKDLIIRRGIGEGGILHFKCMRFNKVVII